MHLSRLAQTLVSALAILLVPQLAVAEFEVLDPKGVLTEMKSRFSQRPFEEVMSCGQSAKYTSTTESCIVRCTNLFCRSECVPRSSPRDGAFELHVDECADGLAHVFGDNGLIVPVTKTEFENLGGHFAVPLLKQFGQFIQPEGTVILDSHWISVEKIIRDGKMQPLKVHVLRGELKFGKATQTETFELWLSPEFNGANQIVALKKSSDIFMQLSGAILPKPKWPGESQ